MNLGMLGEVPKKAMNEEPAQNQAAVPAGGNRDIHGIGGARVENLRLKSREATLDIPGISVLNAPTPGEAAQQLRLALPKAKGLHEAAKTVGSTSAELIRGVGFDLLHVPSKALPNHYRLVPAQGIAGFEGENLARLADVFVNTTGH